MGYKIIKYTPVLLTSLTSLLTETFSIKNKDKKALVRWKYFDPYFKKRSVTYIALDNRNKVIGHYSSMPFIIARGKTEYKTTLSTDAAIDKRFRGKKIMSAISRKLYKDVKNQGYAFSYGFPNEVGVKMDKYSESYGYRVVGTFVMYFKLVIVPKSSPYLLEEVNSKRLIIDMPKGNSNYYKIKKDKKYLIWRYLKKPNREYEMYRIVYGSKTLGYAVLRYTKFICYVYDIVGDLNEVNMKAVLRSIENTAYERKIRLVIYRVLDNKYWKGLFKFPYLKMPIARRKYYFSIHPHKDLDTSIFDKDSWLIMGGDIL